MTDRTQEAQRLLGEIRYQVFRPEVTTVGNMEPLIAEIEALRAELRRTLVRQNGEWQARVERLAEALGLAMDWNWLDEDARPSRTAEICDAALDPTAALEAAQAEREVICAEAVKYADKSGRLEAKVDRLADELRKITELRERHHDNLNDAIYIAGEALRDHEQEVGDGR